MFFINNSHPIDFCGLFLVVLRGERMPSRASMQGQHTWLRDFPSLYTSVLEIYRDLVQRHGEGLNSEHHQGYRKK